MKNERILFKVLVTLLWANLGSPEFVYVSKFNLSKTNASLECLWCGRLLPNIQNSSLLPLLSNYTEAGVPYFVMNTTEDVALADSYEQFLLTNTPVPLGASSNSAAVVSLINQLTSVTIPGSSSSLTILKEFINKSVVCAKRYGNHWEIAKDCNKARSLCQSATGSEQNCNRYPSISQLLHTHFKFAKASSSCFAELCGKSTTTRAQESTAPVSNTTPMIQTSLEPSSRHRSTETSTQTTTPNPAANATAGASTLSSGITQTSSSKSTTGHCCSTKSSQFKGETTAQAQVPTQTNVIDAIQEALNMTNTTEGVKAAASKLQLIAKRRNLTSNNVKSIVAFLESASNNVENEKISISSETFTSCVNTVSELSGGFLSNQSAGSSSVEEEKRTRSTLVKSITKLALGVRMNANQTTLNITTDALQLSITEYPGTDFPELSFAPNTTTTNTAGRKLRISIPGEATHKAWGNGAISSRSKRQTESQPARRSAFIFYKDDTLFYSEKNATSVIALNLGRSVPNLTEPVKIQHSDETAKYGKQPPNDGTLKALRTSLQCAYWDWILNDWSSEGCCLISTDPPECNCYHMTNFALLVATDEVPADVALSVVSDVGCVLSIFGLLITIIVHAFSRETRKRRPAKILMHICANLMMSYVIFVAGVGRTENSDACTAVTVFLHYFMLTTWCWMAVYSYDMYLSVVKVFRKIQSGFLQRVAIFAYVTPLVIVILTVGIAVGHYDKQDQNKGLCPGVNDPIYKSTYRAEYMCWLSGFALYLGFLLPVGIILLFNLVVFAMVFREISCKNTELQSTASKRSKKQTVMVGVTMATFLGITWIVGYLMLISNDPTYLNVMSWIFAVLNTLQGVVIFLMTSVRSVELRQVWWKPLRNAMPDSSSWAKFSNKKYTVTTSLDKNQKSEHESDSTSHVTRRLELMETDEIEQP